MGKRQIFLMFQSPGSIGFYLYSHTSTQEIRAFTVYNGHLALRHRRRIYTEEKAKVVSLLLGGQNCFNSLLR